MKKKIVALILVLCVGIVFCTACGSSFSKSSSSSKKKTVKIVTGGDGLPYSLVNGKGKWSGIDHDMWKEIAKRNNWKIKLEKTTFDSVFGQLDAGRADVAANCFAVKKERTDKYLASIAYYGDAQAIAVPEDSSIKTFSDLKGKKVGITTGQASETIVRSMAKKYGFTVVTYDQSNNGCKDMELGRIDAMASAVTVFKNYMHANKDANFTILKKKLMPNNVAYFFPKTKKGEQLRDQVNKTLKAMIKDGTVSKITKKYLYADMTKQIDQTQSKKYGTAHYND